MTPTRLFVELIIATLPALHTLLIGEIVQVLNDIDAWNMTSSLHDISDVRDELIGEINDASDMIAVAIREVRSETSGYAEETIVGNIGLALIDNIIKEFEYFENMLTSYQSLVMIMRPIQEDVTGAENIADIRRMALRLWKHGKITAENEVEGKILYLLARQSMISDPVGSDVAASQGREMIPSSRTVILKYLNPAWVEGKFVDRLDVEVNKASIRVSTSTTTVETHKATK
jgi:hypothetical protein